MPIDPNNPYDFEVDGISVDPGEAIEYLRNYCLERNQPLKNWEAVTMEQQLRKSLNKLRSNGITDFLINSMVWAVIECRMKRNNKVCTIPEVSYKNHQLACMLCEQQPVVCAMALTPDRRPKGGYDDISFVFFICQKHARDHDLIKHDIVDRSIWAKCYEMRDEVRFTQTE